MEVNNLDSNVTIYLGYQNTDCQLKGVNHLKTTMNAVSNVIEIELKGLIYDDTGYKTLEDAYNNRNFIRLKVDYKYQNIAGVFVGNFKFISYEKDLTVKKLQFYSCKLQQLSDYNRLNPLEEIRQIASEIANPGDINHWKLLFITTKNRVVQGYTLEDYAERHNLDETTIINLRQMNLRFQEELEQIEKHLQKE